MRSRLRAMLRIGTVRLLVLTQRAYWFVVRPRTTGVKVAIISGNDVLLVQHVYHQRWNLPGGGFKLRTETPEEAARREIREELGIELDSLRVIGQFTSRREYKRDRVYCFAATPRSRSIITSNELAKIGWFAIGDIPTEASPTVCMTLAMLGVTSETIP